MGQPICISKGCSIRCLMSITMTGRLIFVYFYSALYFHYNIKNLHYSLAPHIIVFIFSGAGEGTGEICEGWPACCQIFRIHNNTQITNTYYTGKRQALVEGESYTRTPIPTPTWSTIRTETNVAYLSTHRGKRRQRSDMELTLRDMSLAECEISKLSFEIGRHIMINVYFNWRIRLISGIAQWLRSNLYLCICHSWHLLTLSLHQRRSLYPKMHIRLALYNKALQHQSSRCRSSLVVENVEVMWIYRVGLRFNVCKTSHINLCLETICFCLGICFGLLCWCCEYSLP